MDERYICHKRRHREEGHSVDICHVLSVGLHTAGDREYLTLVAQGHYRCPHCRRADITETSAIGARLPDQL